METIVEPEEDAAKEDGHALLKARAGSVFGDIGTAAERLVHSTENGITHGTTEAPSWMNDAALLQPIPSGGIQEEANMLVEGLKPRRGRGRSKKSEVTALQVSRCFSKITVSTQLTFCAELAPSPAAIPWQAY